MTNETKILPLNEIVGASLLAHADDATIASLKSDANTFIHEHTGTEIASELSIVENSNEEVHLTLPYYSMVEDMHAQMLEDDSIGEISGGEILIALGIAGGFTIGALITAGTVSMTGAVIGSVVGGAIGVVALAGVATGAGIHLKKKGK